MIMDGMTATMRVKLLVGFVMLAAAAPLCAQAAAVADAASKADVWNSWRAGPAEPPAMHARVARQSDSAVAAMGESVASFSVPRVMTGSATTAPSRAVQATVAPEMN